MSATPTSRRIHRSRFDRLRIQPAHIQLAQHAAVAATHNHRAAIRTTPDKHFACNNEKARCKAGLFLWISSQNVLSAHSIQCPTWDPTSSVRIICSFALNCASFVGPRRTINFWPFDRDCKRGSTNT